VCHWVLARYFEGLFRKFTVQICTTSVLVLGLGSGLGLWTFGIADPNLPLCHSVYKADTVIVNDTFTNNLEIRFGNGYNL